MQVAVEMQAEDIVQDENETTANIKKVYASLEQCQPVDFW